MTPLTNRRMAGLLVALVAGALLSPRHMAAQPQRRYGGGDKDPQPTKATLAVVGGMLIDGTAGTPADDQSAPAEHREVLAHRPGALTKLARDLGRRHGHARHLEDGRPGPAEERREWVVVVDLVHDAKPLPHPGHPARGPGPRRAPAHVPLGADEADR